MSKQSTERDGPEAPLYRADCPCTKKGCELHGKCDECRAKHGKKGQLPRCER
jgi:hypothetical protein